MSNPDKEQHKSQVATTGALLVPFMVDALVLDDTSQLQGYALREAWCMA